MFNRRAINNTAQGNYTLIFERLAMHRRRMAYRLFVGQSVTADRRAFQSLVNLIRQSRAGECPGVFKPSIPTGAK